MVTDLVQDLLWWNREPELDANLEFEIGSAKGELMSGRLISERKSHGR